MALLVPDDLWAVVDPLLARQQPNPKGRRPGAPDCAALVGILFVRRAGIQWHEHPGLELGGSRQRRQRGLPAILITSYAVKAASLAVGNALGRTFTLLRKSGSGIDLADRAATLLGWSALRAEAGD